MLNLVGSAVQEDDKKSGSLIFDEFPYWSEFRPATEFPTFRTSSLNELGGYNGSRPRK